MNLIEDPWLPFRLRGGGVEHAPPSAVVRPEIVDLALPRADFQGAAWQFLIGLLQTTFAPANRNEWRQLWEQPPAPEALDGRFLSFRDTFHVFGNGPNFMQDFDPLENAKNTPASALLIEAPGDQGIRFNTDHFVKRGVGDEMCPPCAAVALFTLQTTGPAGGTGYRVGIRGGGPLTTLVLPSERNAPLWQKLLLNVLTRDGFEYPDPDPTDWRLFPWLAPTRTSEPKSPTPVTTPDDMHPLHVYWAMPNRIRLNEDEDSGQCRVCGQATQRPVRSIRITNYGYNYDGPWRHPLTPYVYDPKKADPPISRKGQHGGLGYRHWESLVLEDAEEQGNLPALVIRDFLHTKHRTLERLGHTSRQARLWVFGYDLKQNKPRGWYSTEMPIIAVDEAHQRERLLDGVRQLTQAAESGARETRNAVKSAWFTRPGEAKGDFSFIDRRFWEATSAVFYECLSRLAAAVDEDSPVIPSEIAAAWHRAIRGTAERVFKELAFAGDVDAQDLQRVIAARNSLRRKLSRDKDLKALRQAAEQEETA